MKKLIILVTAVAFTAMSAKVVAQVSTGTNPAPGATHNYHVTDNGLSVQWSVTKGDLSTPAGDDAVIDDNSAYSMNITWDASVVAGDWYYVHVVESDGTCTNEKVLPVQIIESPFTLSLAAANTTQCYNGAVTVSLDENDPAVIHYDHGNATVEFSVTPSGLSPSYNGYSFDINLAVPDGYLVSPSVSGNATIDSGTVSVADNEEVVITCTVTNTNDYTNAEDVTVPAVNFTATASISGGRTNNGVADNGGGTYTGETSVSRPNTSGIATN